MRKLIACYIIASFLSVSSFKVLAGSVVVCGPGKYMMVYENGIFNSVWDATDGMLEAEDQVAEKFPEMKDLIDWELSYNASQGIYDVYKAFSGKVKDDDKMLAFLKILAGLEKDISGDTVYVFRDIVKVWIANIDITKFDPVGNAAVHLESYRDDLSQNYMIIIISHSYGNESANIEVQKLYEDRINPLKTPSVAIVAVASPDGYVYHHPLIPERHITAEQDWVIAAVRAAALISTIAAPMDANVDNGNYEGDKIGHNFKNSYLNKKHDSDTQILNIVGEMFRLMKPIDDPVAVKMSVTFESALANSLLANIGTMANNRPTGPLGSVTGIDGGHPYGPIVATAKCRDLYEGKFGFFANFLFAVESVTGSVNSKGYYIPITTYKNPQIKMDADIAIGGVVTHYSVTRDAGARLNPLLLIADMNVVGDKQSGYSVDLTERKYSDPLPPLSECGLDPCPPTN